MFFDGGHPSLVEKILTVSFSEGAPSLRVGFARVGLSFSYNPSAPRS